MNLVPWKYEHLEVMMIEIDDKLYCTTEMLARALGVQPQAIRTAYNRHKDEFEYVSVESLSVTGSDAKEYFHLNKHILGIKKLRTDMRLWSEEDMIILALLSKSNQSREFRKQFVQFVKANAIKGSASKEDYENLKSEMEIVKHNLAIVMQQNEAKSMTINQTASLFGTGLNLVGKVHRTNKSPKVR